VARATRSNHAPGTKPEPGPPGTGRLPGVRPKSSVDAAQLLTREKLRRVERHRERSKRDERQPRYGGEPDPLGSSQHRSRAGRRKQDDHPLVSDQNADESRILPCLGRRRNADETTRTTGNMANPMIGSRVQQTCKVPGGESRRSREERQGRNESGTWQPRTEGGSVPRRENPREDTHWQLLGAAGPLGEDT
jgi:hypothetical protein